MGSRSLISSGHRFNHLLGTSNPLGDYGLGETLLKESASIITLCAAPSQPVDPGVVNEDPSAGHSDSGAERASRFSLESIKSTLHLPELTNRFARSRSRSPSPTAPEKHVSTSGDSASTITSGSEVKPKLTPLPRPPTPRRLVILVVGIKPHRKLWTTSARPEESVIQYILLNGCPSVVVPVKVGAPLVAWDTLTLEQLWEVELPPTSTSTAKDSGQEVQPLRSTTGKFEGIIQVLLEFLDFCIDWERVIQLRDDEEITEEKKRLEVKAALALLVASAVRSRDSKEARKELDKERSGIAMWRIP